LDGNHWKFITFPAITTTFVATTIIDIGRSTSFWIIDEDSGDKTFFCRIQVIRTIGIN
jgi:hypothetical protein